MSKSRPNTAITGAAGEFYVASYLSALGFVVALPRGGVPSSDLLVTTPEGNNTISLQVKTATKPDNPHGKYGKYLTWGVSSKSKNDTGNSHWYAFVALYDWPQKGGVFLSPSPHHPACGSAPGGSQRQADRSRLKYPSQLFK
jgi:hypothetical protein